MVDVPTLHASAKCFPVFILFNNLMYSETSDEV